MKTVLSISRVTAVTALTALLLGAAGAAQARGGVSVNVGIGLPFVAAGVGYAHGYGHRGYGYGYRGWGPRVGVVVAAPIYGYGYGYGYGDGYGYGYDAPVIVQSPPVAMTERAAPAAPSRPDPVIYPRSGQSANQTEADRQQCNRWATTQPAAVADAAVFQRAVEACMDGRGYTVR